MFDLPCSTVAQNVVAKARNQQAACACSYRTDSDINTMHIFSDGIPPEQHLFMCLDNSQNARQMLPYSLSRLDFPSFLIGTRAIAPVRLASDIPDLVQLRSDFHHRVADHARVQTESPLNGVLRLCARVEAHDEVVAVVVESALLAGGFGQEEGPPVCEAADYAAGGEDLVSGCAGDSVGRVKG
jgi:hypothetical protein